MRTFESGGNLASSMYKSLKTTVMTAIADALFSATLKAPVESFALYLKATLNQALGAAAAVADSVGCCSLARRCWAGVVGGRPLACRPPVP